MFTPFENWTLFIGVLVGCFVPFVGLLVIAACEVVSKIRHTVSPWSNEVADRIMNISYIVMMIGWLACLIVMGVATL